MDFEDTVHQLALLIDHLPPSLPCYDGADSHYATFLDFSLDPDLLDKTGDEVGAINEQLKRVFGWKSRTSGDGIIPILERGKALRGVTDVLRHWYGKHPGNQVLAKWAHDICEGVKKVYHTEGHMLPSLQDALPAPPRTSQKRARSPSTGSTGYAESETAFGDTVEHDKDPDDQDDDNEESSASAEKQTGKGGRTPIELLNKICIKYEAEGTRSKKIQKHWRCVGQGCKYSASGNPSVNRVYLHAEDCKKLKASHPELHAAVVDAQARAALERRNVANGNADASSKADAEGEPPKKKRHEGGTVEDKARETGRARLQAAVNHAILILFCVCGIPLRVLDTPEWKTLMGILNANYLPPSSNTFAEKLIPQEAMFVRQEQQKILAKSNNLTISFDGGSTRKDSIYFVHATTPEREHFFIDGHVGTDEKHTAEWVADTLKQVRIFSLVHLVSAFVSDRASNAIGGREIILAEVPVALDLGDSCHHLQNTTKDITKLPEFQWMNKRLKSVITHFSKSTYSRAMLKQSGEEEGEKVYNLKKIGKTRFGSHHPAASSLLAVMGHIRKLVQNGSISFKNKTLASLFSKGGRASYTKLESALQQYVDIVEAPVKAICALEASHATLSDVFVFFLAIAAHLNELFNNAQSGIDSGVADDVTEIFNDRYDEIFDEDHDEYFVTFALDPRAFSLRPCNIMQLTHFLGYPMSDILLVAPTMNPTVMIPRPGIDLSMPHPRAYDRVKEYLKQRLRYRIFPHYDLVYKEHGQREARRLYRSIHDLGKAGCRDALKTQLQMYWQREYPFNDIVENDDSYAWWKTLLSHPKANVLAMLAVGLFSILPNSMPDERTGSKFTWLNSALRGSQNASSLVYMVQIGQWYQRVCMHEFLCLSFKSNPSSIGACSS
ncbi:ribonuclease H-like domain-containing protein [Schizophyllum amplum]|uniref:Ribonuclease H-like domain-containing protein n=1 Tax=Schizophyllum amplum TaxID=97359 RepID=A0A550C0N8_9AGAR|nr:ribonuclease H-like domain-containing protein [Auriculariopsis ampla]